ncbi:MAG TPA: PilN domain-containing protein [Desulfuromonadales bacterium]|nr:PilN domain-containing protein [Desulfuromonadales bacterium]
MRYTINLATRTYLDNRLINRIAFGAIALLLVLTVWNILDISSNMGELSRLKTEIAAIEGRLGTKPGGISEAEFSRQKSRIRFYNAIIDRKSTNWLKKLELFESVTPEGIALSSLIPDIKKDSWKLEGRAHSFKKVQLFVEKLEAAHNFSNVLLLSHQSIAVGEKTHGVQFTISCKVVD